MMSEQENTIANNANLGLAREFRRSLESGGSPASTIRTYGPRAEGLAAWMDRVGLTPETLQPDSLIRYYIDSGKSDRVTGVDTGSISAFVRYLRGAGRIICELDMPTLMKRGPRKLKRPITMKIETVETSPESGVASNESANGAASDVTLGAETGNGSVATPPVATPPQDTQEASGVAARAGLALASMMVPRPQVVAAPTIAQPSPLGAPMKPPKIADRRQTQQRDPLGAYVPTGGSLRISRVSDGSDGMDIGKGMRIGEYTAEDLIGYADIHAFILHVIHPHLPPLRSAGSVVYRVQKLSDLSAPVGAPFTVAIPNMGVQETPASVTSSASGGNPRIVAIEQASQKLSDDMREWFERQLADRDREIVELRAKVDRGQGSPADGFLLRALMEKEIKFPPTVLAEAQRIREELDALKAPPVTPLSPNTSGFSGIEERTAPPFPPETKTDITGDLLKTVLERVLERPQAQTTFTPPPSPQDDLMKLIMAKMIEKAFSGPQTDPAVVEMIKQQGTIITQVAEQLKKGGDLGAEITKLRALQDFIQDLGGGKEESGFLDTLVENLPAVAESVATIIKTGQVAAPKLRERKTASTPSKRDVRRDTKRSAETPKEDGPLPVGATQALEAMINAEATDDQLVINSLFSSVDSMMKGPAPWPVFAGKILTTIQRLGETEGDRKTLLRNAVINIYRSTKNASMLTEAGIDKVLAILVRRFDEVYESTLSAAPKYPFGLNGETAFVPFVTTPESSPVPAQSVTSESEDEDSTQTEAADEEDAASEASVEPRDEE